MSANLYYLAKHSRQTIDFLNSIANSGCNRSKSFEVAVAYSLASKLALPTDKVDDITMYFRIQHEAAILGRLNHLNEILPFNTKAAKEAAKAFYNLRVYQANPAEIPLAFIKGQELKDFFGINHCLPAEVIETIENEGGKITNLLNGVAQFYKEIQEKRVKDVQSYISQRSEDVYTAN